MSHEREGSQLIVDAERGKIHRLMPNGKLRLDIGSDNGYGYKRINLRGYFMTAHRLIYMHFHGPIPDYLDIDHINGDRSDNRIENLRLLTRQSNLQNQRSYQKRNTSKMLGVSRVKKTNKFTAQIRNNGKKMCLGTFDTAEEAHEAYLKAKREMHAACTI